MILGLDLAWRAHNPSGAVALQVGRDGRLGLCAEATLGTDDEILQWIAVQARGGPCLLGIDGPLVAPNGPGTSRAADRCVTQRFGRFHAGAYPANREVARRATGLARRLRDLGWSLDPATRRQADSARSRSTRTRRRSGCSGCRAS